MNILKPEPETVAAMTTVSYINWPWLSLDEFTKIMGCCIALFMAVMAYRKHRLEMKLLKAKLNKGRVMNDDFEDI